MIASCLFHIFLLAMMSGLIGLSLQAGVTDVPVEKAHSIRIIDDPLDPVLYLHEEQVNGMLGSPGFGRFRAIAYIHGGPIDAGFGVSWSDDDGKYEVPLVDLVGSLDGAAAAVHPLSNLGDYTRRAACPPSIKRMETLAAFKQRDESFLEAGRVLVSRMSEPEQEKVRSAAGERGVYSPRSLDEFEQQALRLLQAGHAMVVKQEGEVFRALGAIRMQESCRRCHENKKNGDLLGSFTYLGLREREATADEQKRRAQLRLDAQGDLKDAKFIATYLADHRLDVGDETKAIWLDFRLSGEGVVTKFMVERMRALRTQLPKRQERAQKPWGSLESVPK